MKASEVTCPACGAPPGALCVVGHFGELPRLHVDGRGRVWGRARTRPHYRRRRLAAKLIGPIN